VTAAQPGATLDLSIRAASQPPPPASAGAAPPPPTLTLLAALPDGKLHECSLEAQTLPVPKLAAGSVWTQRLWVRSRAAGAFRLQAVLSCPALVTQHAELMFVQPFEHRVRLSAEAGVHTLVGPSPAFEALNGGAGAGAYGDSAGAAWTAAAAAAAAPNGSQGPLGAQGVPGGSSSSSSSAVPLVVGQSLFAQVLVATSHGADLLLLGAELELEQGSQLQVGDVYTLEELLGCKLQGDTVAECTHVADNNEGRYPRQASARCCTSAVTLVFSGCYTSIETCSHRTCCVAAAAPEQPVAAAGRCPPSS
jgi:hypothetical protein